LPAAIWPASVAQIAVSLTAKSSALNAMIFPFRLGTR